MVAGDSVTVGLTTDCATVADVLPLKFPSPRYAALAVRGPAVLNVNEQLPIPAAKVPVQLSPVEAVTVTEPVGVPLPCTVNPTVTACPGEDGFGVLEVIVVVLAVLAAVVDWLAAAAA